ncbi:hypothetical protein JW897_12865 [Chromobacterium alkanivorans]|uniref:hypothetical protein n=1 Tax=Chromobacterium TaxID=535 RepID=UPI0012E2E7BA|nr:MULTISPECIES: hypothetical protein [Chromobacterium]MBN3004630.1 hypothetical protein [Chromobacterium alkanivorans]
MIDHTRRFSEKRLQTLGSAAPVSPWRNPARQTLNFSGIHAGSATGVAARAHRRDRKQALSGENYAELSTKPPKPIFYKGFRILALFRRRRSKLNLTKAPPGKAFKQIYQFRDRDWGLPLF